MSEDRCPYCNVALILDSEHLEWVCPMCGTVYGYEMLSPFMQSSAWEHRHRRRIDPRVIETAEEMFEREVLHELKKLGKRRAERIVRALESIVKKRTYDVDWGAVREAIEFARSSGLDIKLSELRSEQILRSIRSLVESCNLGVSAEDIYAFATKHRDLWSGRKPETIATVFTYLYLKLKVKVSADIPMKQNTKKLAKIFERVLVERGE